MSEICWDPDYWPDSCRTPVIFTVWFVLSWINCSALIVLWAAVCHLATRTSICRLLFWLNNCLGKKNVRRASKMSLIRLMHFISLAARLIHDPKLRISLRLCGGVWFQGTVPTNVDKNCLGMWLDGHTTNQEEVGVRCRQWAWKTAISAAHMRCTAAAGWFDACQPAVNRTGDLTCTVAETTMMFMFKGGGFPREWVTQASFPFQNKRDISKKFCKV